MTKNDQVDEITRLRALEQKMQEYDHHNEQANFDWEDGEDDPMFYDDAFDEERLATKALDEAVFLSRGMSSEEAREKVNEV